MKHIRLWNRKAIGCGLVSGAALFGLALLGGNGIPVCAAAAIGGAVLGICFPELRAHHLRKKERQLYDLDMADYLTTVSLLLSSGLTIWDALRRALRDSNLKRPLYRDIRSVFEQYDSGRSTDLVDAFERMALACRVPSVSTFVCTVVQNYKKGSDEAAELFMDLARTCRNERRLIASRLADEATTLLLIP